MSVETLRKAARLMCEDPDPRWYPVAGLLDEIAAHHDNWAISRGLQPVARRAVILARVYLAGDA